MTTSWIISGDVFEYRKGDFVISRGEVRRLNTSRQFRLTNPIYEFYFGGEAGRGTEWLMPAP